MKSTTDVPPKLFAPSTTVEDTKDEILELISLQKFIFLWSISFWVTIFMYLYVPNDHQLEDAE